MENSILNKQSPPQIQKYCQYFAFELILNSTISDFTKKYCTSVTKPDQHTAFYNKTKQKKKNLLFLLEVFTFSSHPLFFIYMNFFINEYSLFHSSKLTKRYLRHFKECVTLLYKNLFFNDTRQQRFCS